MSNGENKSDVLKMTINNDENYLHEIAMNLLPSNRIIILSKIMHQNKYQKVILKLINIMRFPNYSSVETFVKIKYLLNMGIGVRDLVCFMIGF